MYIYTYNSRIYNRYNLYIYIQQLPKKIEMNIQEMWPEITSFIRTVLKETVEVKHRGEEKKTRHFLGESTMFLVENAWKCYVFPGESTIFLVNHQVFPVKMLVNFMLWKSWWFSRWMFRKILVNQCNLNHLYFCSEDHSWYHEGWGPQDSVQLPYNWLNSMVYGRYNYS